MKKIRVIRYILIAVLVMGIGTVARAATINVTTVNDNVPGSLREAITTANTNGEDDTIYLPAGIYILSGTAEEDGNISGDLDIDTSHTITIIGDGAGTTFIDGNQIDRVLHILNGTVSISSVTIQNGKPEDGHYSHTVLERQGGSGGGIKNCCHLILTNCIITNNMAGNGFYIEDHGICTDRGDGGYGGGIYNSGNLELTNCTIENNSAGTGGGAYRDCYWAHGGHGGGIYNSGTQSLENCFIKNNTSGSGVSEGLDGGKDNNGGDGGGIYNCGTQEIINCQITFNSTGIGKDGSYGGSKGRSGHGGGVYNDGACTVLKSSITHNYTGMSKYVTPPPDFDGCGGGIYNVSSISLSECTISHNYTGYGGNGGGACNNTGEMKMMYCTVSNNSTSNGEFSYKNGGNGGGIFNGDTLILINCTVSSNNTGSGSNHGWGNGRNGGDGGGIYTTNSLTLTNCTICNNTTGSKGNNCDDGEDCKDGCGGGIYNSGTANIKNTIVANNQVASEGEGPDCFGTLYSQGYNLIEDTSQCTIDGIITGNITGVGPMLDTLADNGGPTRTHALLFGSPAIDAGDSTGISQDQRGYTRPVDIPGIDNVSDGSDIGAYEFNTLYTISGTITYNETGLAGVALTFSNSGGTAATNDNGNYSHTVLYGWSGTVTPSKEGYTFSPSSKSYTSVTANQPNQDYTAYPTIPPRISLNRTQLNFGVDTNGNQSGSQTFLITNSGSGILNWTVSDNANWLDCAPTSGTGSAVVTVSVDPSGLSTGTYTGTITVEDSNASNSPQTVGVTLSVYNANATGKPFGYFETPIDGSTVRSSIPVTGWALDDVEVMSVKIYRKNGTNLVYIGDAVFVEGARPDVEQAYPNYPNCYKAGWGYMMLTNFLPNGGNGSFTLYAIATDKEGNQVTLGTKTILCDNANAVKPFGAIDTPAQGGTASGNKYTVFGWALTPLPNTIPTNGSTIEVWVDGVSLGNPVYNQYREDIAALFPNYNNSNGAVGYYYLDTTQYENGVHTIAWSVEDDAGNIDGIGSRYFSILNSAESREQGVGKTEFRGNAAWLHDLSKIPIDYSEPVGVIKGYQKDVEPQRIYPVDSGDITIEIQELERLEVRLFPGGTAGPFIGAPPGTPLLVWSGYQVIGSQLRPLPIGSTLEMERGIFYWQPGPGFIGNYEFIFIEKRGSGELKRKIIRVKISPRKSQVPTA